MLLTGQTLQEQQQQHTELMRQRKAKTDDFLLVAVFSIGFSAMSNSGLNEVKKFL